jgi:hypothetical protein
MNVALKDREIAKYMMRVGRRRKFSRCGTVLLTLNCVAVVPVWHDDEPKRKHHGASRSVTFAACLLAEGLLDVLRKQLKGQEKCKDTNSATYYYWRLLIHARVHQSIVVRHLPCI